MRLFDDVISTVDNPYFAHALALAERGRGTTSPNPLVGCVIVRDDEVVGEGFHVRAGESHAEVLALADAGERARASDVYVTLEPCAHTGRTPPCCDALIAAGVRSVSIGMADPTDLASGGASRLREAGIAVTFAPDPQPFALQNREWLKRIATGLPFVSVKVALTVDAHPSLRAGKRASITGASGARVTMQLRRTHSAVAVGVATVIADDPRLTVRAADGSLEEVQPRRVILVRETAPPVDAALLRDGVANTLIVAHEDADLGPAAQRAAGVIRTPANAGTAGMLAGLAAHGVDSVLVEAGPRLFTALWNEGLVDELVTVTAGGMAGMDAPALYLQPSDPSAMEVLPRMKPVETGIVGDVSVTVWRPVDADNGI